MEDHGLFATRRAGELQRIRAPGRQALRARTLCLVLLVAVLGLGWAGPTVPESSDRSWTERAERDDPLYPALYPAATRRSLYVTMRDGVRIAIDVHLPEGLPKGERIPAIIRQTRYVRAFEYRRMLRPMLSGRFDATIEWFVRRGYAWIDVDARGSGASFGSRPYPYSEEEVRDGAQVVDWIVAQPWSNERVAAWGNSYDGASALFLVATGHKAIRAVMPRFAFFDAYGEGVFPGGVHHRWLTDTWGALAAALDANAAHEFIGPRARIGLKGALPVSDDTDRSLLEAAVAEHEGNGDVRELVAGIEFRDDRSVALPNLTLDKISPSRLLPELERSKVPPYLYSGWYDASFILSQIHLFVNLTHPDRRLTIGPWDHGGWQNISPYAQSRKPDFNDERETLRFFDPYLRDEAPRPPHDGMPVHYFTMGEEVWKAAPTWPPPGAKRQAWFLAPERVLTPVAPTAEAASDGYEVDFEAGSGDTARWNSLVNPSHDPIEYPDRAERDERLLHYTSLPLKEDMEVTGHPLVTLYLSSTATDGNVFAYLEDVDEDGRVTYVTEGLLRAVHRKLSARTPPFRVVVPYRTYERADAAPLVPGQVAQLVFDLYPCSYLFQQGHRVRLALAGADADHFVRIPQEPVTVRYHRSTRFPSRIELPVMRRPAGAVEGTEPTP